MYNKIIQELEKTQYWHCFCFASQKEKEEFVSLWKKNENEKDENEKKQIKNCILHKIQVQEKRFVGKLHGYPTRLSKNANEQEKEEYKKAVEEYLVATNVYIKYSKIHLPEFLPREPLTKRLDEELVKEAYKNENKKRVFKFSGFNGKEKNWMDNFYEIPYFPDYYMCYSSQDIISLKKTVKLKVSTPKDRNIKDSYLQIKLIDARDQKEKQKKINDLVLLTFGRDLKMPGEHNHHEDKNKRNNDYFNLTLCNESLHKTLESIYDIAYKDSDGEYWFTRYMGKSKYLAYHYGCQHDHFIEKLVEEMRKHRNSEYYQFFVKNRVGEEVMVEIRVIYWQNVEE